MALELPKSPPKPDVSVKDSEQKRRKNPTVTKTGRLRHGPDVTILDFDVPNPEADGIDKDQLELVETQTTERVVRVQSPYFIVRVHHKTYRRKGCQEEFVSNAQKLSHPPV